MPKTSHQTSREIVLNKQAYDAAKLAQMIKRVNAEYYKKGEKPPAYYVPHSRRRLTDLEIVNIMKKAGRDFGKFDIPLTPSSVGAVTFDDFVSKRKKKRTWKAFQYSYNPSSAQAKTRRGIAAKIGQTVANSIADPVHSYTERDFEALLAKTKIAVQHSGFARRFEDLVSRTALDVQRKSR